MGRQRGSGELLDLVPDLIMTLDRDLRVCSVQPTAGGGLIGDAGSLRELITAEDRAAAITVVAEVLGSGHPATFETELTAAAGTRKVEMRLVPATADEVLVIVRDITELRAAEDEIRRTQVELEGRMVERSSELQLLARVFERTLEAVLISDAAGTILRVNEAFTTVTGYTAEEAVGANPRLLKSSRHDAAFYRGLWRQLVRTGEWSGSIWNRRKSGEVYPCWQSISAIRDEAGRITHFVSVGADISRLKRAEERLHRMATHDPLTGLPNRALFNDRLGHAMARSGRTGDATAVLFIDLDEFKPINDDLGHAVGDEVLKETATRLRSCVRRSDTVARIGGDEFAVIVEMVKDPRFPATLADQILVHLAQPLAVEGHDLTLGASIGISLYPHDGEDPRTLLERADQAMYRAKDSGRRFCYHSAEDGSVSHPGEDLGGELARAIELGQLELQFQLQFDAEGRRPLAMETLARWPHPRHGLLTPSQFLPVAAQAGLMVPLGAWVLRSACAQVADWNRSGLPPMNLAVNIGQHELQLATLPAAVGAALEASGLDGSRLELEVREPAVISGGEEVADTLDRLRQLGVALTLEGIGGGRSCLQTLARTRFSHVKIDRRLAARVEHSPADRALVAAIVAMGTSLGTSVVAQGIENSSQLELFRAAGVHRLAGYLLHRPEPIDGVQSRVQALV